MTTDKHRITTLTENQSQKHVSVNNALTQIDSLIFPLIDSIHTDSMTFPTVGVDGTVILGLWEAYPYTNILRSFNNGTYTDSSITTGTIFCKKLDQKLYMVQNDATTIEVGSGNTPPTPGDGGKTSDINLKRFMLWAYNKPFETNVTPDTIGGGLESSTPLTGGLYGGFSIEMPYQETQCYVRGVSTQYFSVFPDPKSTDFIFRIKPSAVPTSGATTADTRWACLLLDSLSYTHGSNYATIPATIHAIGVFQGTNNHLWFKYRGNSVDSGLVFIHDYSIKITIKINSVSVFIGFETNAYPTPQSDSMTFNYSAPPGNAPLQLVPWIMINSDSADGQGTILIDSVYMDTDFPI